MSYRQLLAHCRYLLSVVDNASGLPRGVRLHVEEIANDVSDADTALEEGERRIAAADGLLWADVGQDCM
jgi:hypothetical protein